MSDPKYPIPEDPSYRVHDIRAIQDEDYVSATEVVNPVVEATLESIEYLNKHKAELSADGKVPSSQLPLSAPGGIASLDASGKVPPSQLPSMNYIPTDQKGAANGVPTLDASGKVPPEQLPVQGGLVAQATAPGNTKFGWIDTGSGNVLKYYNGTAWVPVGSVWG